MNDFTNGWDKRLEKSRNLKEALRLGKELADSVLFRDEWIRTVHDERGHSHGWSVIVDKAWEFKEKAEVRQP